jgi:hypothetical protein
MVRVHPDPPQNQGPTRLGAIAQLGERLLCKQEVTGSIPVGSTRISMQAWNSARSAVKSALRSEFQVRLLFKNSEEVKRTRFSQTGFVWVRDCITSAGALSAPVLTKRFLWSFVWRRAELRVIGSSEQVHVMDALATTGDEGRCSLR